jgi:hypothetical protein
MADFALWATACETALWPAGTFRRAYEANRRGAIEGMVEADPVAARVCEIMAERNRWTGKASDLLRGGADALGDNVWRGTAVGPPLPGRWPAGCVAGGHRFGRWALRLPSAAKGEPERGSFGSVRRPEIHNARPSAPSAPSVMSWTTAAPSGDICRRMRSSLIRHADGADDADANLLSLGRG